MSDSFIELNPSTNSSLVSSPVDIAVDSTLDATSDGKDKKDVEHAAFQQFVDQSSNAAMSMSPGHWSSTTEASAPQYGSPIQQMPIMQGGSMPQYTGQPAIESYPTTGEVVLQPMQPAPALPQQVGIAGAPIIERRSIVSNTQPRFMPTSNPHYIPEEDHYGSPIDTSGIVSSSSYPTLGQDDSSEPASESSADDDQATDSTMEKTNDEPVAQPSEGSSSSSAPVPAVPYSNQPQAYNGTQAVPQYPVYNEDYENQVYPAGNCPVHTHPGTVSMPMTQPVAGQPFVGQPAVGQPFVGQAYAAQPFIGNPPPMFQPAPAALGRGCKCGMNRKTANAPTANAPIGESGYIPSFSPKAKVGARSQFNTIRPQPFQSYEKFAFEEKEQFPKPGELLRSAVYFFDLEVGVLQPHFQSNTAIAQTNGGIQSSESFDFDYDASPRIRLGLESEFGPGFELDCFQFDQNSDLSSFTSDGVASGATELYQLGGNQSTSIQAAAAGEALNAQHSFELHSYAFSAFKALKFKRARIAGRFGLQYVQIQHELDARVFDTTSTQTARLVGTSEFQGIGPRFGLDYFRPVGHTPLEFATSATASLLFGNRDQKISNEFSSEFSNIGADEFITTIDIFAGLQTRRMRGEKRSTFARVGYVNQSWLGGGTANDPSGDFGLQGISFAFGVNR